MKPQLLPAPDQVPAMLTAALGQLDFARRYTLELLATVPDERWFEIPAGFPAPVAWHVGHLAVSQYGLMMFRIRGRQPEDLELIPGRFRKAYGRGSVPSADAANQPSPTELRQRLQTVHEQSQAEISRTEVEVLLESVELPYAAYPIKLGAILFCPLHEQIHCGHLGLIRRGLGLEPIR